MSEPKDFLGDELLSTFGMREYEWAIADIIKWLASDEKIKLYPGQEGYDTGAGWRKLFRINTFPKIDAPLFAMLCAAGWIENNYFPKYTFWLSEAAVKRLEDSVCEHLRSVSYTAGDPFEECQDCKAYRPAGQKLWRSRGGVVQVHQPKERVEEGWTKVGEMSFKITGAPKI